MNTIRTQLFALLFCGTLPFSISAQEAVSASGSDAQGSGGSVSYSVGQVAYSTISDGSYSEAQGVQHTFRTPMAYCIEVYLFGLFNPTVPAPDPPLRTTLNDQDLLPLVQPFSGAPWNYTGTESVTGQAAIPDDVADWVLLRAWDTPVTTIPATPPRLTGQVACFVNADGSITAVDGSLPRMLLDPADAYFIEVVHQNHLPVSTAIPQPVNPADPALCYDFTFDMAQAYINPQLNDDPMVAMLSVNGTSFGMVPSNVQNADFQIDGNDLNLLFTHYLENSIYAPWDTNRDGLVDINDINMLFFNYNRNAHRPF